MGNVKTQEEPHSCHTRTIGTDRLLFAWHALLHRPAPLALTGNAFTTPHLCERVVGGDGTKLDRIVSSDFSHSYLHSTGINPDH